MKTWGLHKKSSLHTWGLRGGVIGVIIQKWQELIKFSVNIKRTVLLKVRI